MIVADLLITHRGHGTPINLFSNLCLILDAALPGGDVKCRI